MLYSKDSSLEDRIVELITDARTTIKSLHARLKREEILSLRAVYKAINKLINAGVLLKVGKQVIVDHEWAKRVSNMLGSASAPTLLNGERAVYTFVSVEHLDSFWKTIVLPLEKSSSAREIFFYNPHNFWAYLPARKESEDAYYQHFSDAGHHGFFTVGGNSEADAEFKRKYQHEYLQIDLRNIRFLRETDHITILGSFIITVRLSKRLAEHINTLYASEKAMYQVLPGIIDACQKPGKIRFIIENNFAKALRLKKILAKNFYFKGLQ